MAKKLISPEYILPSRMTLHVPNTDLRFSILEFPYANAINAFMDVFKQTYYQQHEQTMPYRLMLPYRQLNNAIIALSPSIIQGFEPSGNIQRMVTFTRYDEYGEAEDYPSLEQLQSLIKHWIFCWSEHKVIQDLLQRDANRAWLKLQEDLNNDPETAWQHNINPALFAHDLDYEKGLAYVAIPALLTTLIENKTIHINSEQREYPITWRRVNAGGKNGFYLVSQPFIYKDDYLAYRLDLSVQNQAGYTDQDNKLRPWIFAHLSIQRYIGNHYKGDAKRSTSVLVGFNRENFDNPWNDHTTTLVQLGVDKGQWEDGTARLLGKYMINPLIAPEELFKDSLKYGNYDQVKHFRPNEYYVVYAEGRKFAERQRKHQVSTGTSFRERSQIMAGVLSLLEDWLTISTPYQRDMQNPYKTFALRDYNYMAKKRVSTAQDVSWQNMLQASLASNNRQSLHIVILYRSEEFKIHAKKQIEAVLLKTGDLPIVITHCKIEPALYMPLDAGDLNPQLYFKKPHERPKDFDKKWNDQMRLSFPKKHAEWREFLQSIAWEHNARHMVLIDSTGERSSIGEGIPTSQKIKGAIRDACNQEGILSQFVVGDLKFDADGKLNDQSAGRLKNATLDLILRQQAILYAPPHEIYTLAGLDDTIAHELDVIVFCRVNSTSLSNLNYVLAVRLRADGTLHVMLPDRIGTWMPYDVAHVEVGLLVSKNRHSIFNPNSPSPLKIKQGEMLNFVHDVLVDHVERPTIAVIEAEGWRNGFNRDKDKPCWTQLRNPDLTKTYQSLRFDNRRRYDRSKLPNLLCVIRLRAGRETPQYITAGRWTEELPLRDIPHLTSYVDPCVAHPLHFLSVAQLSEGQKKQKSPQVVELFKGDNRDSWKELAYKHPQIIELVPFFVRDDYFHDEGMRQLCRCIHLLRNSPGFVLGAINQPYPMHLGEALISDQLCIIKADS